MPLKVGTSAQTFSENVKAEVASGKPRKQSVAIAYAQKAKAEGVKHLADGGVTDDDAQEQPLGGAASDLIPPDAPQPPAPRDPRMDLLGAGPASVSRGALEDFFGQPIGRKSYDDDPRAADGAPVGSSPPPAVPPAAPSAGAPPAPNPGAVAPLAPPAPAVDTSGLQSAERRIEKANTAAADLSSTAPAREAQSAAIAGEGKTIAEGGKAAADVSQQEAAALSKADEATKARHDAQQAAIAPLLAKFNTEIDPEQKWKSMGFGAKALSIIGMAMGAFAQGYSQGKLPNAAADYLNHAIEQNIAAQKANKETAGRMVEFARQNGLDADRADDLGRLSMRQQFGAKLQAIQSKNLSDQAQAHLQTLDADNKLRMAELQQRLTGSAEQQNAAANYGLEATKAQLGAQAAAAGANAGMIKPVDAVRLGKTRGAHLALLDLYNQVKAGVQATFPSAHAMGGLTAPLVDIAARGMGATPTQQAIKSMDTAARAVWDGLNPDVGRAPTQEQLDEIKSKLPNPYHTDKQSDQDFKILDSSILRNHQSNYFAAHGQAPPLEDPFALAPPPPPPDLVSVINPNGKRVGISASQLPAALQQGYRRVQ